MEHKTFAQMECAGEITPALPLTRAERLEHWAAALERLGSTRLRTLWRTEHLLGNARPTMRADNSPLSVAFEDPVLRVAGLTDDSYGEAKRFFELSDRQLHWLVCFCRYGETMSAGTAARQVRAIALARPAGSEGGWFARMFFGRAS